MMIQVPMKYEYTSRKKGLLRKKYDIYFKRRKIKKNDSSFNKEKVNRIYKRKHIKKQPKIKNINWDMDYSISRKTWDYEFDKKFKKDRLTKFFQRP